MVTKLAYHVRRDGILSILSPRTRQQQQNYNNATTGSSQQQHDIMVTYRSSSTNVMTVATELTYRYFLNLFFNPGTYNKYIEVLSIGLFLKI